ncbi:hypothetical protein I553_3458 [Mycobacterium xenopi 4042]|uniref:Uncharacterized protein n=1 Tax=Mycobacterium xenopi 4042 TaxID=1299334 RepID=X7ZZA7_MYCXE|nr:hypothetical protein I553_3458 [Mycobacterium xenopi 4042]
MTLWANACRDGSAGLPGLSGFVEPLGLLGSLLFRALVVPRSARPDCDGCARDRTARFTSACPGRDGYRAELLAGGWRR